MNVTIRFFLCISLLIVSVVAWPPAARADIANAPGSDLEVFLVTYGPGAIYWERFGHDAIEIRDRLSGEAVNFNYGVFDFNQNNFLLNFARGHMRYSIDAERTGPEMAYYARTGRFVHRQRLAFTPAQAAALRDFLLWNVRPGNRQYHYNYYTRNCATRVRDALNAALGGVIKAQLQRPSDGITYRHETDRLLAAQPWLMVVLDLGLAGGADQPLNRWQASFIPMQLARTIRDVHVRGGPGGSRPLVTSHQVVATATLPAAPAEPPNLIPPLLIAGLVLGLLLALAGNYRGRYRAARVGFGVLGTLWLLFAGIAGIGMACLWAFTLHYTSWANENLLLFSPLALLLIASTWRRVPSRLTRIVVLVLTAAALFALLAKVLPGFDQRNLPWICFGIPPWLAMAWTLHRPPERNTLPSTHV